MRLDRFDGNPKMVTVFKHPSPELVIETVDAMNNDDRTGFLLDFPEYKFSIYVTGGNNERVVVQYNDGKKDVHIPDWQGILCDTEASEANMVEISIQGELDEYPFRYTVSKELAKKVVIHFMTYGRFPDNLVWSHNIDD